jgi:predicted nuclease with TOPRIM domain
LKRIYADCSFTLLRNSPTYMAKNLKDYGLFGSLKRGNKEVEEKLQEMVAKMQTPENLEKMVKAVATKRRKFDEPIKPSRLDFSKFEEKLNQAKKDYFGTSGADQTGE